MSASPPLLTGATVDVSATDDFNLVDPAINGQGLAIDATGDVTFSDAAGSSVTAASGLTINSQGTVDVTVNGTFNATSNAAVSIFSAAGPASITVEDTGSLIGTYTSINSATSEATTITNHGTIQGGLNLGSGDDQIILEAGSSSNLRNLFAGGGSDTMTVRGNAILSFDFMQGGGGTGDGDTDRIIFDGGARTVKTGNMMGGLIGWDEMLATGGVDLTLDSDMISSPQTDGSTFESGFLQVVDGGLTIDQGATVRIAPDTFSVLGNITNSGHLNLADGTMKMLIVGVDPASSVLGSFIGGSRNYISNNGTLSLDVALGDSSSAADVLVIHGDTSGMTTVNINNVGGTGAQTTGDGISVIQVQGRSDGDFVLGAPVIAGAYSYDLWEGPGNKLADGKGDLSSATWYLISSMTPPPPTDPVDPADPSDPATPAEPTDPATPADPTGPTDPVVPPPAIDPVSPVYQPGVPTYEAYPQALLALNGMPSLHERVGNRYWNEPLPAHSPTTVFCKDAAQNYQCAVTDEQAGYYADATGRVKIDEGAIWTRIEGAHNHIEPKLTTSSTDYEINTWKLQSGLDGQLYENDAGKLIGGVTFHYGQASTDTFSIFGDGSIDTTGYGFGGTLTWYGDNGFYVDGQAQVTWYDSDLSSDALGLGLTDGNDGFGYALSVETGKRIDLNDAWTLTPQAQLVYSSVDFDRFTDPFGAVVSLDNADSLRGRLGLSLEHQSSWKDEEGKISRTSVYGIGNLYYEFLDGSTVDVSGTKFTSRDERLWGGIGVGGSYNWNDDKYSVYGEVSANTSLARFADSYSLNGTLGIRVKW
jgi:outer membrane autotransporter protein